MIFRTCYESIIYIYHMAEQNIDATMIYGTVNMLKEKNNIE